jgi:hypothetical protein
MDSTFIIYQVGEKQRELTYKQTCTQDIQQLYLTPFTPIYFASAYLFLYLYFFNFSPASLARARVFIRMVTLKIVPMDALEAGVQ